MINQFRILNEAKYFSSGIFQNYLVFMPDKKYIRYVNGTSWINSWKSNRMWQGNIEKINKSGRNLAQVFVDHHIFSDINFNGHCLIKNNISITKKVINLYFLDTTQRALHVESTSIRRGYYVDTSKTKFRPISTSFPRTSSM